jgi:hypothetical protein
MFIHSCKIRAFNLYQSSEGDLSSRERVLGKYLPHEQFVDYSPFQFASVATVGEYDESAGDDEEKIDMQVLWHGDDNVGGGVSNIDELAFEELNGCDQP